jgi:hypothetical protein
MRSVTPGPLLVREVRIGFIRQGSTMKDWCKGAGVSRSYMYQVIKGVTNGPNAQKWRDRIIDAAKINEQFESGHRLNGAAA